jgi:ABC-type transport system involved in multi-copper enzyme maturation permease subunit
VTWLTWRVERSALLSAAALVVVFALVALFLNAHNTSDISTARTLLELGPPAFATMVAVFWGAPTIAREYEQRTYKVVWSRERPATRWLAVRVGHLLAPLVVLTVGVNLAANLLQVKLLSTLPTTPAVGPFDYDLWLPLQLLTVIAGFGLGVLIGGLVRNSLLAMGITLVCYVVLRFVLAVIVRPHLLPSVRLIDTEAPPGAMTAGVGYLDQAGNVLPVQDLQSNCLTASTQYKECMARGIAHGYLNIHPADQIPQLRLVELGIYVVLAVVTFAAAWLVLRRRTVS